MSVNVHVIQAASDPVAAPDFVGQHWINTSSNTQWLAVGTSGVGDWQQITSSLKVKVSSADTTADFLNPSIVTGTGTNSADPLETSIQNPAADEKLLFQFDQSKLTRGTPSTIGTANSAGTSPNLASLDHVHAHGAQTDGTLHAAATTSVAGFMSAADKTKLDHWVFGFMQYYNSATNTTTVANTTYAAVSIDTDLSSFANSLFTKASATEIRTDFAGYVRVSYKVAAQNTSANDRPFRAVVVKNGTLIAQTSARNDTKTNTDRYGSVAGSFILPCAVNDLFVLGFGNAEATDSISIYANGAVFTVEAIYKS